LTPGPNFDHRRFEPLAKWRYHPQFTFFPNCMGVDRKLSMHYDNKKRRLVVYSLILFLGFDYFGYWSVFLYRFYAVYATLF
jgi:hypothetical protein